MTATAQSDDAAALLDTHRARLQWFVENWRDTGSFERFAHIRNLLSCFPELQTDFEAMLAVHGFAGGVNALVAPLLHDMTEPGEAAILAFETGPLSVLADHGPARDLSAALSAGDGSVADSDALYVAACARMLRRRLSDRPRPEARPQALQAADLRALLTVTGARPAGSEVSARMPVNHRSLESLAAIKDEVSGVARLKSVYAVFDGERRVFSARLHDGSKPIVHGPYLPLAPGPYEFELELNSERAALISLSVRGYQPEDIVPLSACVLDAGPGPATLPMRFDWPEDLAASHVFELQATVAHPAVTAVEVTGFRLRRAGAGEPDKGRTDPAGHDRDHVPRAAEVG